MSKKIFVSIFGTIANIYWNRCVWWYDFLQQALYRVFKTIFEAHKTESTILCCLHIADWCEKKNRSAC